MHRKYKQTSDKDLHNAEVLKQTVTKDQTGMAETKVESNRTERK